jgi:LysM repeat protein
MKQYLLSFVAFSAITCLYGQDVTSVLFNRDCMSQLEYRYSYPNLKGEDAVWAYSMKPNVLENYIFMTEGAGEYAAELPEGTVNCRSFEVDDAMVTKVNRGLQNMQIVFQRQSGGYWVMPVKSITLVERNGSKYFVRSQQSSFQFDTIRMVNEQNLAVAGSPTSAYYSGAKINNCMMEYSFHCEPVKVGQMRSDLQFIPGIGIINDRTGKSASQALENEIQLVKVNGKDLEDFITGICPEETPKIAATKYQKPRASVDEVEEDKEISSIRQKEQDPTPATYSTDAAGIRCVEEWEPGTHIVQKGENLRAIARTYKVTEQQLIKWNKISNPDRIEVCQKIWLKQPNSAGNTTKIAATQPSVVQPGQGKTVRPQMDLSDKNAQKPATLKNPEATRPAAAKDQTELSAKPVKSKVHIVARGEYLKKIAKMYGCPEECIRLANSMPEEGEEPLYVGEELIIPECSCTVNGKPLLKPTQQAPVAAPVKAPEVKKQTPAKPVTPEKKPVAPVKKPKTSILDDSEIPQQYSNDEPTPEPQRITKPNLNEESTFFDDDTRVNEKKPVSASNKKSETAKVPLFKEHHVKQGENLKSIAAKYHVDASELSQVNGLDPKENLTPGKLILIPVEQE